ncbi:hypothetical protein [Nocardia asiatica]|uniref:hypothetical protein n=1 Tax=Nocardia asiatica TaxID=209252 RepID=UPI0002F41C31|nr:hypothetical protein [Nocardia asiatica]
METQSRTLESVEKRLDNEQFATFSVDGTIVAVYRIEDYERVADVRPGAEKIALIGRPCKRPIPFIWR